MFEKFVLPCSTCGSKLEIPQKITRFVCSNCGCEQLIHRDGGIVALAPVMHGESGGCLDAFGMAVNKLHEEIRDTKIELEKVIETKTMSVPNYVLLRYDFLRIGKLALWSVHYCPDHALEQIFRSLNPHELERLIKIYERNPKSPMKAWLTQVRELRKKLYSLTAELERLQVSAGTSPAL